jgi:hypothetical protein
MKIRNRPLPSDFVDQYHKHNSVHQLRKHYNFNQIKRWLKETNLPEYPKQNLAREEKIGIENIKKIVAESKTYLEIKQKIKLNYGLNYSRGKIKSICKRQNINENHLNDNIFIPSKEEIIKLIDGEEINKKKLSDHFNVPWQHIDIYLKKYNIECERYSGTILKLPDLDNFKKDSEKLTRFQLAKKYNVSLSVIERWGRENNVFIRKESDSWKSLREEYDLLKDKVIELNKIYDCKKISEILNLPYIRIRKIFTRNNIPIISHSYNKSKGELEVRDFILSLGIECFSRKFNYDNKTMEIDCFIPKYNLGIEYCGEYWHSEEIKGKKYHQEKTLWAQKQNIKILTIFENEWINKKEIIKSIIKNNLGLTENKIMARKCIVKEIFNYEANQFVDKNHIQGKCNSSVNIGLFYKDELKQIISFSKSRFNKKFQWEITRISTELGCNVTGGVSKLFSYFKENYKPQSIISYCDLRFSNGDIYKKLGFEFLHISMPNYWYKKKDDNTFFSRQKFQKHKLEKILPFFDVNLSEKENMKNNNYICVYDAGNFSFIWKDQK